MRFLVFTRTKWHEPPRLRRQVSEMLLANGHEVHFFEKRKFLGRQRSDESAANNLTLHCSGHLLHHQLKIVPLLNRLDTIFLKKTIRQQIDIQESDVVINFCYDFYFLRELFPRNPMIHVVNDDYLSAAIWPHRRSAKRLLHLTAKSADRNLVVSYLIESQIREATENVDLFFPWARHEYEQPVPGLARTEVLYWGYINERVDERITTSLMNHGIKINFVGNVIQSPMTDRILGHENALYHGAQALQDIPDVRNRCCCAIIPYDVTNPYVPAVTISNRGFEILSFGLPLLYSDLPSLLKAPNDLIKRCRSTEEFVEAINYCRNNFDNFQEQIRQFLIGHTVDSRYKQFMTALQNIITEKSR